MTLFERIIAREIPADILFEDDDCLAFRDIHPQAPVHFLVIPKKPIATLNDLQRDDETLIGHLFVVAARLAAEMGFAEDGYRAVINCNEQGGQTVYHLHVHILAGRVMGWPPFTDHAKH